MTANDAIQLLIYLVVLIALAKPLCAYMAWVYEGRPCGLDGALGWLECRLVSEHETGDHTLFVGEVLSVEIGEAAPPLVHVESGYRTL